MGLEIHYDIVVYLNYIVYGMVHVFETELLYVHSLS